MFIFNSSNIFIKYIKHNKEAYINKLLKSNTIAIIKKNYIFYNISYKIISYPVS